MKTARNTVKIKATAFFFLTPKIDNLISEKCQTLDEVISWFIDLSCFNPHVQANKNIIFFPNTLCKALKVLPEAHT
jgi:hypothetical protein